MEALNGAHFANKTLMAGFTTVRDLGGNPEAIYALRDAVGKRLIPGPRIFSAGSALSATGGHGDIDGVKPQLLKLWTLKQSAIVRTGAEKPLAMQLKWALTELK
jgi:imidazolonepropionase-like amidohydrolase